MNEMGMELGNDTDETKNAEAGAAKTFGFSRGEGVGRGGGNTTPQNL